MFKSVLQPKTPTVPGWERREVTLHNGDTALAFYHNGLSLNVISAVEAPDPAIGPEYHLSISRKKRGTMGAKRCTQAEATMVLKQFNAEAALEDNHTSIIRNFWLPVADHLVGQDCDCKQHESAIKEGDFEWRPLTQEAKARADQLARFIAE